MLIQSRCLASVLLVGSTLLLGACGAEVPEEALVSEEAVPLGTTEQEVYSGWTAYTSDELPPVVCDGGSMPTAVQCTGKYCDNIRLNCQPTAGVPSGSYWAAYFSDEGTPVFRNCPAGYWMTGISCTGSYCDRISIQCTYMGNISAKNCFWTGWHSEEGTGALTFPVGYYPTGAWCRGDYCDNMSYFLCQP
jgi:hypothetical protein